MTASHAQGSYGPRRFLVCQELNASEQLTWVYDDMLIAVSKAGVKAFVPASS